MRLHLLVVTCLLAATASGCWLTKASIASPDAGVSDASVDAGLDAGVDAGVDAGLVSPVGSGLNNPALLAVEGTTVFWTGFSNPGEVSSYDFARAAGALPDGGTGIVTIASMQANPYAIAVDSVNVFWLNYGSCGGGSCINNFVSSSDGSLVEAPLAGGSAVTLATNLAQPLALAVAPGAPAGCHTCAKQVFWVNGGTYNDNGSYNNDGAVLSVPVGGGAITTLFSAQLSPDAIAVDEENVYWANAGTFNAATGAYNDDGAVLQASLTSSLVSTLASGQSYPYAIATDSTNVYWTNAGQFDATGNVLPRTGTVSSVPIGGTAVLTLATAQEKPGAIAVLDPNAYWVEGAASDAGSTAAIVEIPTAGGTPDTLVSHASYPVGIGVGSDGVVYYSDPGVPGGTDGGVFSIR